MLDIYTLSMLIATSCLSRSAWEVLYPYVIPVYHLLIQILVLFLSYSMFVQLQVSPNSVVSLRFFVHICSILYYCDKFNKFVLFLNILTDYFTVSYYIVFLFCIYSFRTKSQFHVKWICWNKFIINIIIIIMLFKTSVNWLFNDTWCYLVMGCFDRKTDVFNKQL